MPITDEISNLVMAQMLHLESEDPDKDINLYINSPGGSITSLLAIYDTMEFIKPDVATICMGQAASAAAVLLAAGTPGKRMALPHARVLMHQPHGGAEGQSLDIRRLINSKTWERLRDHPDLNGPAVDNGNALNFLLHRLSGTLLAYHFSEGAAHDPAEQVGVRNSPRVGVVEVGTHGPDGRARAGLQPHCT
jgi:hypothetical protein